MTTVSTLPRNAIHLLTNATATGAGNSVGYLENCGIQVTVTGTGAVTATVDIEVTNDETNWLQFDVVTLSGTNLATDGTGISIGWADVRANVKALTGTGAAVTVIAARKKSGS